MSIRLLTVPEAVEYPGARWSATTIRRLITNRELGVQRIGRKMFIPEGEITRYLDRNYSPPETSPRTKSTTTTKTPAAKATG